jgi:hypothetical protein
MELAGRRIAVAHDVLDVARVRSAEAVTDALGRSQTSGRRSTGSRPACSSCALPASGRPWRCAPPPATGTPAGHPRGGRPDAAALGGAAGARLGLAAPDLGAGAAAPADRRRVGAAAPGPGRGRAAGPCVVPAGGGPIGVRARRAAAGAGRGPAAGAIPAPGGRAARAQVGRPTRRQRAPVPAGPAPPPLLPRRAAGRVLAGRWTRPWPATASRWRSAACAGPSTR